jgi:hypothetical protein
MILLKDILNEVVNEEIGENSGVLYFAGDPPPPRINLSKYNLPNNLKFLGEGSGKIAYTDGKMVYKIQKCSAEEALDNVKFLQDEVDNIKNITERVNKNHGLPIRPIVSYSSYKRAEEAGKPFKLPEDRTSYDYVKALKGFYEKYKLDDLDIKITENGIIVQRLAPESIFVQPEGWYSWNYKNIYNNISIVLKEKYNVTGVDLRNSGNVKINDSEKKLYVVEL